MSQLAYNYKGQRFTPPTEAMFWRVRRLREGQRGQLDVVRGPDGRPLIVPIDIDVEGFRIAVNDQVGRYRLDALDEHELLLPNVDAAYVTVPMTAPRAETEEVDVREAVVTDNGRAPLMRNAAPVADSSRPATVTAPFGTWPALPMPVAMTGTEYLLAEALRGQVQMFQMVTAALANQGATAAAGASQMMGAAAELVRAADGAAMPHRPPPPAPTTPPPSGGPAPTLPPIVLAAPGSIAARNAAPGSEDGWDGDGDEVDAEDDQEDDADASAEADMFAKVMTLADKVQGVIAPVADVARLVMGGMGVGMRNAAPEDDAPGESADEDPDGTSTAPDVAHLRTSHILLIAHELGADGSLFRQLLMAMEPNDRQAWTDRLCSMPFEEAVAEVAAKLERIKERQARHRTKGVPRASVVEDRGDVAPDHADRGEAEATREGGCESGEQSNGAPGSGTGGGHGDDGRRDGEGGDEGDGGDGGDGADNDELETGGRSDGVDDDSEHGEDDEENDDQHRGAIEGPTEATAIASRSAAPAPATAPPSPAAVQARMMEIAKHLRVPEILRAQQMVAQIAANERDAWIAKLMAMSPAAAAQVIRAELARRTQR